jgi:hypothetical protein
MNVLRDQDIPPSAKTQVRRNMSTRAFCGIHTGPTSARKIGRRQLAGRKDKKALRDPQIPPDAKTQVRPNVNWLAFYGNCTGITTAWKTVRRRFRP